MNYKLFAAGCLVMFLLFISPDMNKAQTETRIRARDLGLRIGVLPTGSLNSITDVKGVKVGHTTVIRGTDIRTGVTAVIPHGGNIFQDKVPGAVFVGNGFGKLMGSTQIDELGEIETPILLTSTLSVPKTADFLMDYMLALPGNENVRSINPLVAETNDGYLNDIRGRHISREDVFSALRNASSGIVEEGSVGAGTGTVAFGWKGGVGSSSRKLPDSLGGYTVGVLVQTNFGGVLQINGAPVGEELGNYYLRDHLTAAPAASADHKKTDLNDNADGSVIIVIATDAPLDARNLKRLALRAIMGLARTGAAGTNGSGDYAIAFSTAESVRIKGSDTSRTGFLSNNSVSPLFLAAIEATEEAIYNSLFRATAITGRDGNQVKAIPIDKTAEILRKYNKIP
ncbi:MAG: P1 family peptidase [Pyrinomonadaceae bacterium]